MSDTLIDRNLPLKRLRDEGYDVKIHEAHVVVDQVAYVTKDKKVKRGTLRSALTLAGNDVTRPGSHTVQFTGDCCPCDSNGAPMLQLPASGSETNFATLSRKPPVGYYEDYYEQMTTYVALISAPAKEIDPSADARVFPVIQPSEEESVFNYLDTASSRAGITAVSKKLQKDRIVIIGIGGTGSYILDLMSKTPVKRIDIYDADTLLTHNAFRSPGAPSVEELRQYPKKASYFAARYSKMHRGIRPHEEQINESNVADLKGADFVFISMDPGKIKALIIENLLDFGVPFIDVGMGISLIDETVSLTGMLRTTVGTPDRNDHLAELLRIRGGDEKNEYDQNIQIAELNALNAALAVIKWKKLIGFYADLEKEFHSTYKTSSNRIVNGAQT